MNESKKLYFLFFAEYVALLLPHLVYNGMLSDTFDYISFFACILVIVLLPINYSYIALFAYSFHGEGFRIGVVLSITYIVIVFTLRLFVEVFLKRRRLNLRIIVIVLFILAINIYHLDSVDVSTIIRITARFVGLFLILSDKEFVFSKQEIKDLSNVSFVSFIILVYFSVYAGLNTYGPIYYRLLLTTQRLGECYRDFGGADALGYQLCLLYPLQAYILVENYEKRALTIGKMLALVVVGLLAKTRSFLMFGIIISVLLLFYLYRNQKKKRWQLLVSTSVVGLALLYWVNRSVLYQSTLSRFSVDDITHGRIQIISDLWSVYKSSIANIIFGVGFRYKSMIGVLAHNVYLEVLVSWGIVGFILMVLLVVYTTRARNIKIRSNSAMLYWVGFCGVCLTISSISYEHFYIHFVLMFILATRGMLNGKTDNDIYTYL